MIRLKTENDALRVLIVSQSLPPLKTTQAIQMGRVVKALEIAGCQVTAIAGVNGDESQHAVELNRTMYLPCWRRPSGDSFSARAIGKFVGEFRSCSSYSGWVQLATSSALEMDSSIKPHCLITVSNPNRVNAYQ